MVLYNQKMSFQSLQGFHKLVWGESDELLKRLKELFAVPKKEYIPKEGEENHNKNRNSKEKYKAVRLLDTFMSDSFILGMMIEIFSKPKEAISKIEILLLNPFSNFAALRANALGITSVVQELNKTLYYIRKAIYKIKRGNLNELKSEWTSKQKDVKFLFDQYEDIQKYEKEYNLKIKFYEHLTETPIYLFSFFAMKGFVFFNSSSSDNPWMIFVDDPNQDDDLYDQFHDNFDKIWAVAKELPELQSSSHVTNISRNILINHGHGELLPLKLERFLEKTLKMSAILLNREEENSKGLAWKVQQLKEEQSFALLVFSEKDANLLGEVLTPRRVMHEVDFFRAKLGDDKVLLLTEEAINVESLDIQGISCLPFKKDDIEALFNKIREVILHALDKD